MKKIFSSTTASMLIALLLSLFSSVSVTQAAFGVSPPWVRTDLLLPGSSFEETIYLSRSDTSSAMRIETIISGDEELVKWISIADSENTIMKEGQAVLPVKVVVTAPEDAELRSYTGSIMALLKPLEDNPVGGGQVGIGLGANIVVEVKVTGKEVIDYEVKSVELSQQEKNDPFALTVTVKNTGNTELSEIKGSIDIYDDSGTEKLKTMSFVQPEEPLAFNETRKIEMVYEDFKPESGSYWVNVEASKDGQVIYENRLLQKVKEEVVPVITPEDVMIVSDEGEADSIADSIVIDDQMLAPAATEPVAPVKDNSIYIFLFAGLAIFVIGVVIYVQRL